MNQSPTIKWAKRLSHSSSNANKHPYLFKRVDKPVTEKDVFINSANDTFDRIAANLKATKENGGKTTGIELTNIEGLRI